MLLLKPKPSPPKLGVNVCGKRFCRIVGDGHYDKHYGLICDFCKADLLREKRRKAG